MILPQGEWSFIKQPDVQLGLPVSTRQPHEPQGQMSSVVRWLRWPLPLLHPHELKGSRVKSPVHSDPVNRVRVKHVTHQVLCWETKYIRLTFSPNGTSTQTNLVVHSVAVGLTTTLHPTWLPHLCQVMPDVMSCHVMSCHIISCHVMSCPWIHRSRGNHGDHCGWSYLEFHCVFLLGLSEQYNFELFLSYSV